jgi:hypothetical protein
MHRFYRCNFSFSVFQSNISPSSCYEDLQSGICYSNYSFFVLYDATEPGIATINFLPLSPFDGVYWVVSSNSITFNVKVKFFVTRYIPLPSITEFY